MTDRIINSPVRRSSVLEAGLKGAHRSYVNFTPLFRTGTCSGTRRWNEDSPWMRLFCNARKSIG